MLFRGYRAAYSDRLGGLNGHHPLHPPRQARNALPYVRAASRHSVSSSKDLERLSSEAVEPDQTCLETDTDGYTHTRRRHIDSIARRSALMLGLAVAVAKPLQASGNTPAIARGSMMGPSSSVFDLEEEDFYATWPYAKPTDLLPYIYAKATKGDPASVLRVIDEFSVRYPMYNIGPEKGTMLEAMVRHVEPKLIIELGTFVGYSAIRMSRNLAPGGQLVCVEASQEAVDTATETLKFAGLWTDSRGRQRVIIEKGLTSDVLPDIKSRLALSGPAQLIFEDHCKPCYLPDLLTLEKIGMVQEGTLVVADNVVYPGAPDYLSYLRDPANGYAAALVKARYEYDQKWNPDWEPKADALSVAVRGRPEQIRGSKPVAQPNVTVVPPRGRNPPSYGASPPPEELKEAANSLHTLCQNLPNGKRCAPVPAALHS